MIIQVNDVTVENCTFSHVESPAMKVTTGWTETLWCEGVGVTNCVVRNCTFDRCNAGGGGEGSIVVSTYLHQPTYAHGTEASDYPIIRDILFENNRFVDCEGVPERIASAARVERRGNEVVWTRHCPLATYATVRTTLTNGTVRARSVLGRHLRTAPCA